MVQTRLERLPLPRELLTCDPEPEPPPIRSQADVAVFLALVRAAGQDCRANLDAVRGLSEAPDVTQP